MQRRAPCRRCGCGLAGTVGRRFVTIGIYCFLVSSDSPDCNWRQCRGCGDILCKHCYAADNNFCCDEDRIVWRERAQAIADRKGHS